MSDPSTPEGRAAMAAEARREAEEAEEAAAAWRQAQANIERMQREAGDKPS